MAYIARIATIFSISTHRNIVGTATTDCTVLVVLSFLSLCFVVFVSSPGQRTLQYKSDVLETVVLVNPSEETTASEVGVTQTYLTTEGFCLNRNHLYTQTMVRLMFLNGNPF